MRSQVALAVVMLVASVFAFSFAAAEDAPPFEMTRASVTGWGETYQEAAWDAQQQLAKINEENPGWYPKVTGFVQGEEPTHDPPCYVTKFYIMKKSNPF